MKKKKLELKKKVIASLSEVQKAKIIGGDDGSYACETEYESCIDCPQPTDPGAHSCESDCRTIGCPTETCYGTTCV
jgi:hypothetical protein